MLDTHVLKTKLKWPLLIQLSKKSENTPCKEIYMTAVYIY